MSSFSPAEDDTIVIGDLVSSKTSTYRLQSILGQGSYGTVVKCARVTDNTIVAIKMMKYKGNFIRSSDEEMLALHNVRSLDPDKCNIIRFYKSFHCKEHVCLLFESLDKSLFDFLKERYFRPLPLEEIRFIVQQLASALQHLKSVDMIHADLKLENVMLVDHARQPFRIKVIDFGLACKESDAVQGRTVQTRFYRSPEVLLGLPIKRAIDMWSLGIISTFLYLGVPLYPGTCEYEMMKFIVETQGHPPEMMLTVGRKTSKFFNYDFSDAPSLWKLKTPEQFYMDTGIQLVDSRRLKPKFLSDIVDIHRSKFKDLTERTSEMNDRIMFVDMLIKMLEMDANKRITPRQVLEHDFTTMNHLTKIVPHCSYVRSCVKVMAFCQKMSGKPSSCQQKPEKRGLSPPQYSNSRSSTSTQTLGSAGKKRTYDESKATVTSGWHSRDCVPSTSRGYKKLASSAVRSPAQKRKADDMECPQKESGHFKNSDQGRKRFHRGDVCSSTTSHSLPNNGCTSNRSYISPGGKRKMTHDDSNQRSDHGGKRFRESVESTHTAHVDQGRVSSEHHRSHDSSRLKRKADDDGDVPQQKRPNNAY